MYTTRCFPFAKYEQNNKIQKKTNVDPLYQNIIMSNHTEKGIWKGKQDRNTDLYTCVYVCVCSMYKEEDRQDAVAKSKHPFAIAQCFACPLFCYHHHHPLPAVCVCAYVHPISPCTDIKEIFKDAEPFFSYILKKFDKKRTIKHFNLQMRWKGRQIFPKNRKLDCQYLVKNGDRERRRK